ncbi:prepilin-type N-terminal cleavage/methylation domain-containing protein [Shewanella sp. KX20019]|uniref:prepilin-type N-terminal cleavage/methylation domain-containing protein n=1 Tax=Shewanella sp. KX20019 TaxID=2803864 RepID=UPI00192837F1|nr:prepilin-type N-terminal cleavage/methylation domain-containing protein [Shewanella sp. KX20019]QQX81661.1 prepilin-type N-terminal cleavage/methylation domain-containing protein [Shewanella sp. KX20019]
MTKQKGFTLIELIVVIIILGVLAVIAAPRFINLGDDAANATLKTMKGVIDSALAMSYSKMAIEGKEGLASAAPDFVLIVMYSLMAIQLMLMLTCQVW